jgi:hypothetical protein
MRYKVRFDSYLQDMTVNFNLNGRCICELQIKIGSLSKGYGE